MILDNYLGYLVLITALYNSNLITNIRIYFTRPKSNQHKRKSLESEKEYVESSIFSDRWAAFKNSDSFMYRIIPAT